ncbi:MAG TPA: hypothetical protein PKW90_17440, partial [Myxococcota bacterium]|nr:hypothetical protein [Myxococcota bacterium]
SAVKFHRTIHDPLPGERTVALEPPAAPEVDAPWIRQNFVTGRTVSAPALQAEQQVRAGHLGLIGRDLRPGVIEGLEVQKGEDGKSLTVSPGMGICGSGEDVILPQPLVLQIGQLPVRISSRLRYTDYAAEQGAGQDWNAAEPPLEVVLRARRGRIIRPNIDLGGIPISTTNTDSVVTETATESKGSKETTTETPPTKEEVASATEVASTTEVASKAAAEAVDILTTTASRSTDSIAALKLPVDLTTSATRLTSTLKRTVITGETPPIVAIPDATTFSDTPAEPLDLGGLTGTTSFAGSTIISDSLLASRTIAPAPVVVAAPVFIAPAPILAEAAFTPVAVAAPAIVEPAFSPALVDAIRGTTVVAAPATVEPALSPALAEAVKGVSVVSAPAPTVVASEPIGVISRDLGSTVVAAPATSIAASESISVISRDLGSTVVAAPVAVSTVKLPVAATSESISVIDIVGVDSGIRTVLDSSDAFIPITKLPVETSFPSKGSPAPAPALAAPTPVPAPVPTPAPVAESVSASVPGP